MDIVLHIGIQRTGTTFLQHNIFSKIKEINLVNFYRYQGIKLNILGRKNIQKILSNIEKYDVDTVNKELYKYLQNNKINLISNENIYCGMYTKDDDRFGKIDKIKNIFPTARILIGTRNEKDLLLSWYNKYIVNGGTLSLQDFKRKIINLNKFDYEPYIKYLLKLFKKNKIYVYRYEDMGKDINSHVKGICDFIGVDVPEFTLERKNIGYSLWQLKVSRFVNNLFRSKLNPKGIIPLNYKWFPHRVIFQSKFFPKKLRGKKIAKNIHLI